MTEENKGLDEDIVIDQPTSSIDIPEEENTIITITDSDTDRYHTFGYISWWKQDVVRNSRVLVVGAGALGNEVLKNLALMGVGEIFIVDFDTIEDANLSRSVMFRSYDNGRKKAEAAADAVKELNPDVGVQWLHGNIVHDIGLGVFRRMDVVIGCLDNREARLEINKKCWNLNKPWVDGAIQVLTGVARVFWPGRGACYECTLTEEDYKIMAVRESCARLAHANIIENKVPTTPTISSIIAAIETQEALKLMHNFEIETGTALVVNGLINDVYKMEYLENHDCLSHYVYDEIIELPDKGNDTTLKDMLFKAKEVLKEAAILEIPSFVSTGHCEKCGTEVQLLKPLRSVSMDVDGLCEECGTELRLTIHEEIIGEETFLNLSLSEVGIPPLHILPVHTYDWQYKYLELTKDAETYFRFQEATPKSIEEIYKRRLERWQTIKSK